MPNSAIRGLGTCRPPRVPPRLDQLTRFIEAAERAGQLAIERRPMGSFNYRLTEAGAESLRGRATRSLRREVPRAALGHRPDQEVTEKFYAERDQSQVLDAAGSSG